ncbi:MAG: hypothetical protein ABIR32_01955 [Ilumatobacteraceae bacterium]
MTDHGDTVEQACNGAIHKLTSLLDSRFGKLESRRGSPTVRHPDHS